MPGNIERLPQAFVPQRTLLKTYGSRLNQIAKDHVHGWLMDAMMEGLVLERLEEMLLHDGPGLPPLKEIDDHTRQSRRSRLENKVDAVLRESERILESSDPGLDKRVYELAEFLYYNMDHPDLGEIPSLSVPKAVLSTVTGKTGVTNYGTDYDFAAGKSTAQKAEPATSAVFNWNSLLSSNAKQKI